MKVISGLGRAKFKFRHAVMAIGVFDGVHLGHQALIRRVTRDAAEAGRPSLIFTFSPHPYQVLYPHSDFSLLITLEHRIRLLEELGVDVCCIVPFNKRFSRISYPDFIRDFVKDKMRPTALYVGDDFRFGRDRQGSALDLKQEAARYGLKVGILRDVRRGKKKVSSTDIRKLVARGRLSSARGLLGRTVSVMGKVEEGEGLGLKLGFPTLNIYPRDVVLPPPGVYASRIRIGKKCYPGMSYIGSKPTFKAGEAARARHGVEANIFDFSEKVYGKTVIIEFLKKVRSDRKFSTAGALISRIKMDERGIRKFFLNSGNSR